MDVKDVREARRWLADHGWIERTDRPGFTPVFKVRLEPATPRGKRPTPGGKRPTPGGKAPSPKRGRGPLGHTPHPTPGAKAPPNKNPLTRTREQDLEPPLPPVPVGKTDARIEAGLRHDQDGFLVNPCSAPPAATQPQPQQPVPPWGPVQPDPDPEPEPAQPAAKAPRTAKPKATRFAPTADDIPAALLPVQKEILAFWRESSGKKSQIAWSRLMGQLQKIQDDSHGGTEILRDQLEEGAAAGWKGITHANWERYGKRTGTPIGGTGFNRKATTTERIQGALEIIRRNEAAKATQAAAQQSGLVLVEVA